MKVIKIILALLLMLTCSNVYAEIEKTAEPSDNGLHLSWWPKLPAVEGWHHEREPSKANSINAQVPNGKTFSNAETVIYATAIYKPRKPEIKSLQLLIQDDKKEFLAKDPGIVIEEAEPLATGDGQLLKIYTFFPKEKGNWEQVAYGEEGDFYLIFTVSSRTKEGFNESLGAFRQFINEYKEKP